MNKKYLVCLKCGNVQKRTDILNELSHNNYKFIKKQCPKCKIETQELVTENMSKLKTQLKNDNTEFSNKVLKLIRG